MPTADERQGDDSNYSDSGACCSVTYSAAVLYAVGRTGLFAQPIPHSKVNGELADLRPIREEPAVTDGTIKDAAAA